MMRHPPHAMLDIETIGLAEHAPILQVGMVAFGLDRLGSSLDLRIAFQPQIDAGAAVNADAVPWWRDTNSALYDELLQGTMPPQDVAEAISTFWYEHVAAGGCLWADPSTFDVPRLERFLRHWSPDVPIPWAYETVRDLCTLRDLAASLGFRSGRQMHAGGVVHNGLDDAIYQADVARDCLRFLASLSTEAA